MKKTLFLLNIIAVIFIFATAAYAVKLKKGIKAPNWSFEDTSGKIFTMDSWQGKALLINYVDPDVRRGVFH